MRQCSKCKEPRSDKDFNKGAFGRSMPWCRACQAGYYIERLRIAGRLCISCQKKRTVPGQRHCRPCEPLRTCKWCRKRTGKNEFVSGKLTCLECSRIKKGKVEFGTYSSDPQEVERYLALSPEDRAKDRNLRAVYGITLTASRKMLESQGGKCPICDKEVIASVIDHCHRTGVVRGILCGNHNKALGLFKDDPEALIRAAEYLRPHIARERPLELTPPSTALAS